MIFEDVHWIDPTSLELLVESWTGYQPAACVLIITYRPSSSRHGSGDPHVSAVNLNRLGEREIASMIDGVTGNKPLPVIIRLDIIERTDGIPLFVEEMTKAVLEATGRCRESVASHPFHRHPHYVPASLHASLMARLDRLGPAKQVAQIGAAMGESSLMHPFSAVVRKPDMELQSALDRLVAAGLLFRQGVAAARDLSLQTCPGTGRCLRHFLREPRRALHARIVETLENQFAEIAETRPELLARHATEAGSNREGRGLWGEAGQRSLARSALIEAVAQLTRALDQIATVPATPSLRREQIKLHVGLANALMHTKGHAAPKQERRSTRHNY